MKMGINHYNVLKNGLEAYLALYTIEEHNEIIKDFQANESYNDYRIAYIWAVYHCVRKNDESIKEIISYGAYNDIHIETALKKVFKDYGLVYP